MPFDPIRFWLAAALFVLLHGPTGEQIWINPQLVSSVREPLQEHWPRGVKCLLMMTNGQSVSVAESCSTVRDRLDAR